MVPGGFRSGDPASHKRVRPADGNPIAGGATTRVRVEKGEIE